MSLIEVPVSVGELVDKVTILRIKRENIKDDSKQQNILKELSALEERCEVHSIDLQTPLVQQLYEVNSRLWQIEDDIRDCERAKDFGPRFVDLARSVYVTNDQRFDLKAKLNAQFGSQLREEKSYQPYQ